MDVKIPVHDLLERRYSPRVFDAARPVETDKLCSVLEAARRSPSSYNEQPWRFLVASRDDREAFDRMLSCLVPGNQAWAANAGVLMISVAALSFARNGKPNRHALHDVGLATMSLIVQATHLGLYVHPMAGFDVAKARELYGIGEGFEPVAAIAVGYLGDVDELSEELKARETTRTPRRSLEETVFKGRLDSK